MVDRFVLWLGAGAVCAGVAVGMLAGAGVAHAQTESDGDGAAKTSQSAKTAENKPDSGQGDAGSKHRQKQNVNGVKTDKATAATADADVDKVGADKQDTAKDVARDGVRSEAGKRTAKLITNFVGAVTHEPDRKVVAKADPVDAADPVDTEEAVDTDPIASVTSLVSRRTASPSVFSPTESNVTLATPALARSQVAETASAPPIKVPPVVSAIGTAVFDLLAFAESVFEGPPKVPPGSNVTVERSTLDLGNGHVVPADWYFPEGSSAPNAAPPDRIIYLQHGFLARGVFYDYTAAYLAEQTNSVVVAPSLTSNIFATDGMWLGGDQMHRAVADLFLDGNPALVESAQAAGYPVGKELPKEVVLVGHSLGGGLVIDTARLMAADEADNKSSYTLAGVLMLDGVSFTDPVPILEQIPSGLPVYNLSAPPYFWNLSGAMDAALAQVRGGDFHGAQLLGGLHSDSMIGGNPLIQFGAYLITGFSLPTNAEGSQILAAGWINDMFECVEPGGCDPDPDLYGEPGDTLKIPTRFGPAIGLVQPEPGVVDTLARQLTADAFGLLGQIDFATDVPEIEQTGGFGGNLRLKHAVIS